jgi:hypothetical protein
MKNLRKSRLCLGCVFAPLPIFFTLSGVWRTSGLHQAGRDVPALQAKLERLFRAHMQARFIHESSEVSPWRWRARDRGEMAGAVFLCLVFGIACPPVLFYLKGT